VAYILLSYFHTKLDFSRMHELLQTLSRTHSLAIHGIPLVMTTLALFCVHCALFTWLVHHCVCSRRREEAAAIAALLHCTY